MGGGGAMRAAAKAAGMGLQNAGVRGGLPENFAARRAVRSPPSILSTTTSVDDAGKIEVAASSQSAPAIAWELDDWDFAGYEVEEKPRLVFGPAPTLEETEEATSELKDALDKLYFNPSKLAGSADSISAADKHSLASSSESSNVDTKTCVLGQTSVVPSAPNQALKAFKLLKENPAAQTVVASIAADPNVWNAVLQNDALKEYLQSEKNSMEAEDQDPLKSSVDSSDAADAENSDNPFARFFEDAKHVIVGWVDNLSGFFQDLFGGPDGKPTTGSANWTFGSTAAGGSLFALAAMVIMLVVLKRRG